MSERHNPNKLKSIAVKAAQIGAFGAFALSVNAGVNVALDANTYPINSQGREMLTVRTDEQLKVKDGLSEAELILIKVLSNALFDGSALYLIKMNSDYRNGRGLFYNGDY